MALLANLIFFLAIPAAIAAAMAFALGSMVRGWSLRRRTIVAALVAGGLPILLPIIAIVSVSGYQGEMLVPVAALVFGGLFIALVIGFPVALLVGRRIAGNEPDRSTFD